MTGLFERVVVPVASPEDARATSRAIQQYLDDETSDLVVVHVVEKAGGAPDKAGVEQREAYAEEVFDVVREELGDDHPIETEIRYGTEISETIFAAAGDHDATAIVITPRGGSRWIRLLTGDVALKIVTETDRPVVVLPDVPHDEQSDADGAGGGE
jgi:nucleotide-binding universal stress UspA family protein